MLFIFLINDAIENISGEWVTFGLTTRSSNPSYLGWVTSVWVPNYNLSNAGGTRELASIYTPLRDPKFANRIRLKVGISRISGPEMTYTITGTYGLASDSGTYTSTSDHNHFMAESIPIHYYTFNGITGAENIVYTYIYFDFLKFFGFEEGGSVTDADGNIQSNAYKFLNLYGRDNFNNYTKNLNISNSLATVIPNYNFWWNLSTGKLYNAGNLATLTFQSTEAQYLRTH